MAKKKKPAGLDVLHSIPPSEDIQEKTHAILVELGIGKPDSKTFNALQMTVRDFINTQLDLLQANNRMGSVRATSILIGAVSHVVMHLTHVRQSLVADVLSRFSTKELTQLREESGVSDAILAALAADEFQYVVSLRNTEEELKEK